MQKLAEFMDVKISMVTGGTLVRDEPVKLKDSHVIVGTPGRIIHLLQVGVISKSELIGAEMLITLSSETEKILMFVVDEADEMLSEGFTEQICTVFKKMPKTVQAVLLSATMPKGALDLTSNFMRNPIQILVKQEQLTLQGIRQFYIELEQEVSSHFLD